MGEAGAHVSSVGYYPPNGELPAGLARSASRCSSRHSTPSSQHRSAAASSRASTPPPGRPWEPWCSGAPGRVSDTEITVYKAMGIAMEDMVAANLAYQRARREGGGGVMAW